EVPEWVKTSLAPGSKVVRDYLEAAGLTGYLEKLKFHIVGYGCTTCIGNSGPLPQEVSEEIDEKNLVVASVLSGNRNFEGRINPDVRANYLMSPPLVVAFALAGRIDLDLRRDPLGNGKDGKPVFLADVWPSQREVDDAVQQISSDMFRNSYGDVFAGTSVGVRSRSRRAIPTDGTAIRPTSAAHPTSTRWARNPIPSLTSVRLGCWPCL